MPSAANPAERVCPRCSHDGRDAGLLTGPHLVQPGKPPHGDEVRCGGCGLHLGYLPKEGNEGRRRDRNPAHRELWLERHAGDLTCVLCGARRSERPRVAFDVDHLIPLEDGGPDEEWNTGPLCRDCHTIKSALRALRRHAEGLSARTEVASTAG